MATVERPRWRVNEKSFIGHTLVDEGDEVFYTPTADAKTGVTHGVAANLSPLNDEAQAIVEKQEQVHPDKASERAKIKKDKPAEGEPEGKADKDGMVKGKKGDTRKPAKAAKEAPQASPAGEGEDGGDVA